MTSGAAPLTKSPDTSGEALLRASALDALGEAVVGTDLNGHIIYWNDAAHGLYGWSRDEALGSLIQDLLMAEGTTADLVVGLARLRRRGRWHSEFLVRHRDGSLFPVLVTVTNMRDGEGRPMGMVAVARDIRTQRKAEETARHAEERVELMRRAASAVIWEWEVGSERLKLNEALVDSFGFTAASTEPSMEWWRSRIHPDDLPRVAESFDRFLHEDRRFWTEEYRFLTGDRGYATVFDRAYITQDASGEPTSVVGSLVDLTERRRVHEEQRFLSQASMILELSLDYETTLPTIARLAANTVADACILAVAAGEGFPPFITGAHADPRMQAVIEDVAAFMTTGPAAGSLIEQVVRGGESVLMSRVSHDVTGLIPEDGRLAELVRKLAPASLILAPLSARKATVGYLILGSASVERHYDQVDLQMAEELGRRVGLTVDHARLFQSAELANQAKSDFLAIISHELRTPLTAVLGYSDLLSEEVAGPMNERQHRQVERIRAGSDRLLRLIEGILAFARLESGKERPHFEQVHLRPLLSQIDEMVRPSATEKGIEFELEVDQIPDTVQTDRERFIQVVLSLTTNAIKFTERGAVRIRVHAGDGTVRIDISDNGNGIAPEHLPHIFNPFWQAEQPATRRSGGSGLGLSVAQRLARLMNGDVRVTRSTPGGTTFRFEIPVPASL